MKDNNIIPAGSLPPEPVQDKAVETPAQAEARLYAGTFKSPDELEKGYTELRSAMGKQSGELGELRGKTAAYEQMLSQRAESPAPAKKEEAPVDYDGMLSSLAKQYEDGDITFAEAMKQGNQITAQQVAGMTQKQAQVEIDRLRGEFNNTLADRDMQTVVEKFHDGHKDYQEVVNSGALDEIMKQNPMHDKFSAYYAYKAQEAMRQATAESERIRKGSEATEKVLTKPGNSIQQTNNKRTNDPRELRESMLAAVRGVQT